MKRYIFGNWKMSLSIKESRELAESLTSVLSGSPSEKLGIGVAPSPLALPAVSEILRTTGVHVGSQNIHWSPSGAFTGEVALETIKEVGGDFTLVGHSERRTLFGETISSAVERAKYALSENFMTIFCIGETLQEREAGQTNSVLDAQLVPLLEELSSTSKTKAPLIIAYEPVWAIGTGKVATATEIEAAHKHIIDLGQRAGVVAPVLYGGSVSPDNFEEINGIPGVSGALVGGASLKAEKFGRLVEIAGG